MTNDHQERTAVHKVAGGMKEFTSVCKVTDYRQEGAGGCIRVLNEAEKTRKKENGVHLRKAMVGDRGKDWRRKGDTEACK